MDKLLKNPNDVNKLTSSLMYQLNNIRRIRDKLDLESAKTIIQALVLTKLDYHKSLLLGTPECYLDHLQAIQNMACRVICKLWKFDRVSISMKALHWLKIRALIVYKVVNLVYRCHNGTAPSYLNNLLVVCQTVRTLRSSTSCDIKPIFCKIEQAKHGSFSVADHRTWSNLLKEVNEKANNLKFNKKLKTHLFKKSCPEWLSIIVSHHPNVPPSLHLLGLLQITTIYYVNCKTP